MLLVLFTLQLFPYAELKSKKQSKILFLYAEYSYIRYSYKRTSHCVKMAKKSGTRTHYSYMRSSLISDILISGVDCILHNTIELRNLQPLGSVTIG